MKLAFVGKGGSGKSSLSWLAALVLRENGTRTLLVDADHNMDLAHGYGVTVDDTTPTLHRAHDAFRVAVGQREDTRWSDIILDNRTLPSFTLSPKDPFTASVARALNDTTDLIIVGLGAEDVLFSGRCAHGHSAPLKYYLPLLTLRPHEACIIDGVAGVDMMNFGLFNGADAIVVAVEDHQRSVRVFHEIARIASHSGIPVFAALNKDTGTPLTVAATISEHLVGRIGEDEGVRHGTASKVATDTKAAMTALLATTAARATFGQGLERVRRFEMTRNLKRPA
jgi:CO dehydrogenase nickel-insertion accessory protein CooC1